MQNLNNLVTVCIATYNGEKYIKEQLDSIINQSYKNIEIIIQDDCSTDRTFEILKEYKEHNSIKIFQNQENIGYIKNFESVLKKANGEFIAICDQDDIWDLKKLEILLNSIGNNSLIYSNSLLIDENGNSLNKTLSDKLKNNFIDSDTCLNFLYDNCVSGHAMLFKRELIDYIFPLPQNLYFDAWIAATAASLNGVKFIDSNLVLYRQHSSNVLGNIKKEKISTSVKILNKVEKKEKSNNDLLLKIKELKTIKTIKDNELQILEKLQNYYIDFENRWFSISMFKLLKENSGYFFKITTKTPLSLSIKKSIGKKLYKAFPFL